MDIYMKHNVKTRILAMVLGVTSFAPMTFAKEADPVEKIRLAVSEIDLVLGLITETTAADPLLDKMCLRLGRISAILRRVKDSVPIPPEETRIHYVHYEHFCGWEPRPTDTKVENLLPRGFSSDPALTQDAIQKLQGQLESDRAALDAWREAEKLKQDSAP
jgi:hypothetical protein